MILESQQIHIIERGFALKECMSEMGRIHWNGVWARSFKRVFINELLSPNYCFIQHYEHHLVCNWI